MGASPPSGLPMKQTGGNAMKRVIASAAALLLAGAVHTASAQTGDGWVVLLDGKGMDNFTPTGEANWRVEDGALVADKGKSAHLVSKNSYKDFQMIVEFWADEPANSGVFIRCDPKKPIGAATCYEVNIFDTRKDPTYGTGSIVNFSEVSPMPKAAGKWNTFEITAKGRDITVKMNGQETAKLRNGMWSEGHFTLQYGAGTVKFRKVALKPL
jgi:hypothetical protein